MTFDNSARRLPYTPWYMYRTSPIRRIARNSDMAAPAGSISQVVAPEEASGPGPSALQPSLSGLPREFTVVYRVTMAAEAPYCRLQFYEASADRFAFFESVVLVDVQVHSVLRAAPGALITFAWTGDGSSELALTASAYCAVLPFPDAGAVLYDNQFPTGSPFSRELKALAIGNPAPQLQMGILNAGTAPGQLAHIRVTCTFRCAGVGLPPVVSLTSAALKKDQELS